MSSSGRNRFNSPAAQCRYKPVVEPETGSTNFGRFLEHTTPIVPAHYFPKTGMRGWRNSGNKVHPYFILGDLWESFKEWSVYGAGVPIKLNGSDSVVQYYVPFLSAIQLYIVPSKFNVRLRRPADESDLDSSRETSSDGSSEYGNERSAMKTSDDFSQQSTVLPTNQSFNKLSWRNMRSTVDEREITNPPGLLVYEYFEQNTPYSREPLADKLEVLSWMDIAALEILKDPAYLLKSWRNSRYKVEGLLITKCDDNGVTCLYQIAVLASQFPELKTYRSCDLTAASWISVAWYPIYRIPTGPTLQNLDACFLTFHSLSSPFKSTTADWPPVYASTTKDLHDTSMPLKLSLPVFGLATYKFKFSVWNPNGVHDSQKVNSLLRAADNWLRLLQVDHPDFRFFVSRNSFRR